VKHTNIDEKIVNELYKLTKKAYNLNEIPVGAVVIKDDIIIGKGYNNRQSKHNVCGHAEINAIIQAEKYLNDWRLNDCIIISTLKPCDMCLSAIQAARITNIYYIFEQKSTDKSPKMLSEKIYFPGNKKITKISELFNDFFQKLR
jgi:tRNA(Arg) A34 adenosine deaminase TadA